VNQGALLAGPLLKRSDWLHAWNPRFAVLTTEALAWLRLADGSEPMKAILLRSGMQLSVRDGKRRRPRSLRRNTELGVTGAHAGRLCRDCAAFPQPRGSTLGNASLQLTTRVLYSWHQDALPGMAPLLPPSSS